MEAAGHSCLQPSHLLLRADLPAHPLPPAAGLPTLARFILGGGGCFGFFRCKPAKTTEPAIFHRSCLDSHFPLKLRNCEFSNSLLIGFRSVGHSILNQLQLHLHWASGKCCA